VHALVTPKPAVPVKTPAILVAPAAPVKTPAVLVAPAVPVKTPAILVAPAVPILIYTNCCNTCAVCSNNSL
jgi:hypothetical protein